MEDLKEIKKYKNSLKFEVHDTQGVVTLSRT